MGLDPYPSLADPFYVLQYVFFVSAIVLAATVVAIYVTFVLKFTR